MKEITRKKVFVIPYVDDKVMCVQDRETGEWGFISGGVKKNESFFHAAQRELMEETTGLMPYIPSDIHPYDFETNYRPDKLKQIDKLRGEVVVSKYKVYWIPINHSFVNVLHRSFKPNKEIVAIKVGPYEKFKNRWIVCDQYFEKQARRL